MKVLGVIPARYGSVRFPGKALARLNGAPMVELVWRRAKAAKRLEKLVVATDDRRILDAVKSFGGEAVMTTPETASGTDRVWEVAKGSSAQIIVNIQGDEPLVKPEMVDQLVEALLQDPKAQMATLRFPMRTPEGYHRPNIVKVVTDMDGWALYFSRSPIPACKAADSLPSVWYKHLGLYAYRREILEQFVRWPISTLEMTEGLEQLRALEHGVQIKVVDSVGDSMGVDTPEDLEQVEKVLKESGQRRADRE